MGYEEKYYELLDNRDRTFDNYFKNRTEYNKIAFNEADKEFGDFCMEILEKLLEENSDILKRLKERE